jgi:hypothetical protein
MNKLKFGNEVSGIVESINFQEQFCKQGQLLLK